MEIDDLAKDGICILLPLQANLRLNSGFAQNLCNPFCLKPRCHYEYNGFGNHTGMQMMILAITTGEFQHYTTHTAIPRYEHRLQSLDASRFDLKE